MEWEAFSIWKKEQLQNTGSQLRSFLGGAMSRQKSRTQCREAHQQKSTSDGY